MRGVIVTECPSFVVAKALERLITFYRMWELDRDSKYPELRSLALAAKAHGIVAHDRTLNIAREARR